MNLKSVDLNLLIAFDALMSERSVSRAAAKLGITQSAVSHALKRLRIMFGDPLMRRGSRGMEPTERALSLQQPVKGVLAIFIPSSAPSWLLIPRQQSALSSCQ